MKDEKQSGGFLGSKRSNSMVDVDSDMDASEAEDTCMRRRITALVVHFLTALKMSRRNGLSDSVSLYLTWLMV